MDIAVKLRHLDLTSTFLPSKPNTLLPLPTRTNLLSHHPTSPLFSTPKCLLSSPPPNTPDTTPLLINDINSLFSDTSPDTPSKKRPTKHPTGASGISSGVKLENITKSFKGVTLLKNITWEVKKSEKVGLVGVNGAGKTTQMRIISGQEHPDSGNLIKSKPNMKIAFLSQEFEVSPRRTVWEEFLSAFKEEMEVAGKLEKVQKALEGSVSDLEMMGRLLDEFDLLQRKARDVNLDEVDARVSKLMPELGFAVEDSDRLVASFSGGWQMRMCLGKILLQVLYGAIG